MVDQSEDETKPTRQWVVAWEPTDWLVATQHGLWLGTPGGRWVSSGPYEHALNTLLRRPDGLVAAADGGLWAVSRGEPRWRQLHDELLTVVQDVQMTGPADGGLVAATGYGVHVPHAIEHGALRWSSRSDSLSGPSARFSTCLLLLDADTWLVGTEAGLLRVEQGGGRWSETPVVGIGVRALLQVEADVWVGTDSGDLWKFSDDRWTHHSRIRGGRSVLCLAISSDGRLIAGTTQGLAILHDEQWRSTGPRLPIKTIALDPGSATWVVGASPGGLWWTMDGDRWQQVAEVPKGVGHILTPERFS